MDWARVQINVLMRRSLISRLAGWLLHPSPVFSQRVLQAGVWGVGIRISVRLLSFASVVVLARLLAPDDFGVMGAALVAWYSVDVLTHTGFGPALLQKKDIQEYLDTAWSIHVARGALITGLLALVAPYIASFFHAPEAVQVIRVVGLAAFIQELSNPGMILVQRDLEFRKWFWYDVSKTVLTVAATLALAAIWRNVWALAFGLLVGQVVGLVSTYLIHPYRPRLRIDWSQAKALYSFGRWVYVGSLLDTVMTQVDRAVVGRLLGPVSLGFYLMASRITRTFSREVGSVVYNVTIPVYARFQGDSGRLIAAYLRSVETVTSLMVPFATVVFILGDDLVMHVLGDKWLSAVPAIKVLAFAAVLGALDGPVRAMLHGVGRPALSLWLSAATATLFVASVYPLTSRFGITGAAAAVLVARMGTLPLQFVCVSSVLHVSAGRLVGASLPGLAMSGVTALALLAAVSGLDPTSVTDLALVMGLTLPVYLGSVAALWWFFKAGPLQGMANIIRADVELG